MISQEDLAKQVKMVTQNAWRVETNTTVNSICEYIVKESLLFVLASLEDELANINKRLDIFETSLNYLSNNQLSNERVMKVVEIGEINASKNGSIPQSQWNTETEGKRSRVNAKARQADGANVHDG